MRKAFEKISQLYSSSPLFQDLVETGTGGAMAAAGQALFTDMSPEEIALSTGLGFGAAMAARPIGARAGQYVGRKVDENMPEVSEVIGAVLNQFKETPNIGSFAKAKLDPYSHMGPGAQFFNLVGRGYSDNLAQAGVALASPMLFNQVSQETR